MGGGGGPGGGGGFGVGQAEGGVVLQNRFGFGRSLNGSSGSENAVDESLALGFEPQQDSRLRRSLSRGAEPQLMEKSSLRLRRGGARLSVQVELEIPDGYRRQTFSSVADTAGGSPPLSIAVRSQRQLTGLRLICGLLAVGVLWSRRRTAILRQIGLGCVLLLLALGAVPLLSADQQWLPDGIGLGAAGGLVLLAGRAADQRLLYEMVSIGSAVQLLFMEAQCHQQCAAVCVDCSSRRLGTAGRAVFGGRG